MINRFLVKDRKANRSRRVSGIAVYCFLLMAVCIAGASFTYGRYLQSENNNFSASVAVMPVRVDYSTVEPLTLNNTNATEGSVSFTVYRKDSAENVAEVSFSYTLSVEFPEGTVIPAYLTVSLNDGAETVAGTAATANKITFAKTYTFLADDSATEKVFQLSFTVTDPFAVPQAGISLADMVITVHAEQIQEGA